MRDNGNVGIGTATSSYKLDVNGDALINSLGLYDPRNAPLQYPAETVITNLQSGHGYTKQSAAGTQSDDTADYIKGNQSLKLVTDGDASAVVTRKSSISPAIDLTNKYLKVWVKVDNTANVQEFWFYASSNNFSSAWYSWGINDDITQMTNDATSGVWVPITLPFSEASITGSPNRAAINAIQWRVKDKNSTAITANWGGMSALPEPTKGVVSITFDDAWLSQYDEARKKMDEYGFAGTAYIIPDNIGAANFMTLQNLKDLQDKAGWDISAHHQTVFTTLTATQVEQTILSIKNYLLKNGFFKGANDFAYPGGDYDETTVMPLIRKYFRSARTIASYAETYPPSDYHKLRVLLVVNTTATSAIQTAVDNARANKEWLILVFHKIVTTPTVSTEYSIANFGTVIDDINSDGILVRTVSDVLNKGEESISFTAKETKVDLGSKNLFTLGSLGIGTTTPFGRLALHAKTNDTYAENLFIVASSSNGLATTTHFVITNDGNVGISSSTPSTNLSVVGSGYLTGGLGIGALNTQAGSVLAASYGQFNNVSTTDSLSVGGLASSTLGFRVKDNFIVDSNGRATSSINLSVKSSLSGNNPTLTLENSGGFAASEPTISFYNSAGGITHARISSLPGATYQNSILIFSVADSSKVLQERMRIDVNGNVGIGTTSPSQKLSVAGSVLADSYLEYSPKYIGDAISAIKNISHKIGTEKGDWADIDHNTLPEGVKVEQNVEYSFQIGTTTEEYWEEELQADSTREIPIMATSTYLFIGRDLGASVQLNTKGIQQLIKRIEALEAIKIAGIENDKITQLEARIEELEKKQNLLEILLNWLKSKF